jgi:hypothetical protein
MRSTMAHAYHTAQSTQTGQPSRSLTGDNPVRGYQAAGCPSGFSGSWRKCPALIQPTAYRVSPGRKLTSVCVSRA